MSHSYSANELLTNLGQNLGFNVFLFDDPDRLGPEIRLREKSKNGEIDAVLSYKNIICLVGINEGRSGHVESELSKFFEKLDNVESPENLNLYIDVTAKLGKAIEEKRANAIKLLEEISRNMKDICKEYNPIFRKVFFCPSRRQTKRKLRKCKKRQDL